MAVSLVRLSAVSSAMWVRVVTPQTLASVLASLSPFAQAFVKASGFEAKGGAVCPCPAANGVPEGWLFGLDPKHPLEKSPFFVGKIASLLPQGDYVLQDVPSSLSLGALGFLLEGYRFARYRKAETRQVRLALPETVDIEDIQRQAAAVYRGRDLVNMPPNDLGPLELAEAALSMAKNYGAVAREIVGDDLLSQNFPLVHAVGKGSDRAPRLVDFTWGAMDAPKITLVGKGVCYDTGGLDIKPSSNMALMKKDMGGAASILALADMIMAAQLPVRLRVIIPCVENSVSGRSFRTGDVYKSRKGMTVEIGNTDAEGRLILADALALGDEEAPELMIDMATLTGAARVALGPDLPAVFSTDLALAGALQKTGLDVEDPLWVLPLWAPYGLGLSSKIADVNHIADNSFAGAITASLFLARFVEKAKVWVHADIFAWTAKPRVGKPDGGEVQVARAVYAFLKQKYGK